MSIHQADWIWPDADPDAKDAFAYLRREIALAPDVVSLRIQVTASNRYRLYVDGESAGIGPCPGALSHSYYDEMQRPVPRDLAGGRICLSAVAYCVGEKTAMVTDQNQGPAGFRCAIALVAADGRETWIRTDPDWKGILAPTAPVDRFRLDESRVSRWGGYRQVFLAGREPAGWQHPGFDDRAWSRAVVREDTAARIGPLLPREIPFLPQRAILPETVVQVEASLGAVEGAERLTRAAALAWTGRSPEEAPVDPGPDAATAAALQPDAESPDPVPPAAIAPVLLDASRPGSFPALVLDFGCEVVGYPEVDVRGSAGGVLSLWYGESLDLHRTDTLVMSGGEDRFRPYHLRAFRYLKLVANNSLEPVEIRSVRMRLFLYPYGPGGTFRSSDPLLDRIWDTSVYTVRMNSLEHFVDCPLREQAQWLADARVMAMADYWALGSPAIVRKAIRQFIAEQDETGFLPPTGPQPTRMSNLDFPCHFLLMVWEYYFHTADRALLEEVEAPLGRLMDLYAGWVDEDGLLVDRDRKGVFIDWAPLDARGQVTAVNCLYHAALRAYARILRILAEGCGPDRIRRAVAADEAAERLRERILSLLFDPEKGLFADCRVEGVRSDRWSKQATAYAILTGVAPADRIPELVDRMETLPGLVEIGGAFLLSFVVESWFEAGLGPRALERIRDFWGEMLRRGATTWWETFDRGTPACTIPFCFAGNVPTWPVDYIPASHCHAWGSGPAHLLPRYLLGIRCLAPGFAVVAVDPVPCGLEWCEGTVPTPRGPLSVAWHRRDDGTLDLTVDAPEGVRVRPFLQGTGPEE